MRGWPPRREPALLQLAALFSAQLPARPWERGREGGRARELPCSETRHVHFFQICAPAGKSSALKLALSRTILFEKISKRRLVYYDRLRQILFYCKGTLSPSLNFSERVSDSQGSRCPFNTLVYVFMLFSCVCIFKYLLPRTFRTKTGLLQIHTKRLTSHMRL